MSEKIYVPGSAKEIQTQYGPLLKLSFPVADLVAFVQAHKNAKGWVNMNVSRRKSEGKYGETHTIVLDTWQPSAKPAAKPEPAQPDLPAGDDDEEIPY